MPIPRLAESMIQALATPESFQRERVVKWLVDEGIEPVNATGG